MMRFVESLLRNTGATAAVEMALVMPILLIILFGSVELGNYFMNEHTLTQAVRDGARFAARQSFTNYTTCNGSPDTTNVVTPTQNIVMNAYRTGGTVTTPDIAAADISVTTSCAANVDSQDMLGIYRGRANGAQIVRVEATNVPYRSVLGSLGFTGLGMHLNASSEAAVTGI